MIQRNKVASTPCAEPSRIEIRDRKTDAWYATLTLGSYTVSLSGPRRSFTEGRRRVDNARWVRLYPHPFDGQIDFAWLNRALEANRSEVPDILALGFQYIVGSRRVFDGDLQVAGNARYGPLSDGVREEGADFNDYLGVVWTYPDEPVDRPESRQIRSLDCSGFVRMVYGFRRCLPAPDEGRVPLCRAPRDDHSALPRRSHEMFHNGPGIVLIDDDGSLPTNLGRLSPGDLLFFDADTKDGPRLDHVAIYLGLDTRGSRRFLSSRKRANGPTMDDIAGRSILDGDGLYARAFRAARRI